MATKPSAKRSEYDIIEPTGERVVIRKDDNKRETRSGIVLPDSHEIPVITGRVIAISKAIENDEDQTIRQYDKVLFDPREAIPVELEHDNKFFVVAIDRVLAIFRKSTGPARDKTQEKNLDANKNAKDRADEDGDGLTNEPEPGEDLE
jgi:chaperonin GroES